LHGKSAGGKWHGHEEYHEVAHAATGVLVAAKVCPRMHNLLRASLAFRSFGSVCFGKAVSTAEANT
jgi:hypothetical protein